MTYEQALQNIADELGVANEPKTIISALEAAARDARDGDGGLRGHEEASRYERLAAMLAFTEGERDHTALVRLVVS